FRGYDIRQVRGPVHHRLKVAPRPQNRSEYCPRIEAACQVANRVAEVLLDRKYRFLQRLGKLRNVAAKAGTVVHAVSEIRIQPSRAQYAAVKMILCGRFQFLDSREWCALFEN